MFNPTTLQKAYSEAKESLTARIWTPRASWNEHGGVGVSFLFPPPGEGTTALFPSPTRGGKPERISLPPLAGHGPHFPSPLVGEGQDGGVVRS